VPDGRLHIDEEDRASAFRTPARRGYLRVGTEDLGRPEAQIPDSAHGEECGRVGRLAKAAQNAHVHAVSVGTELTRSRHCRPFDRRCGFSR
jgi:hypothetical protein